MYIFIYIYIRVGSPPELPARIDPSSAGQSVSS